jgi:hypothetical protein
VGAAGPTPIGAAPLAERDVEAPEVFDVTDAGLWDGRPSLGGVWVAHPRCDRSRTRADPQYRDRELRDRGAFPSRTREPRPAVPDLLRRGRCARHPRRRSDGVAGHRSAPRGGCTGRSSHRGNRGGAHPGDGSRICTGVRFRNGCARACGIRPRRGVRRRDGGNGCAPLPAPVCSRARRGRASAQHVGRGRDGRHHPRRLQPR